MTPVRMILGHWTTVEHDLIREYAVERFSSHILRKGGVEWRCSCPSHSGVDHQGRRFRGPATYPCKHLLSLFKSLRRGEYPEQFTPSQGVGGDWLDAERDKKKSLWLKRTA